MTRDPLRALAIPPFEAHPALASGHLQTVVVPWLPAPSIASGEPIAVPIATGASLVGRLHRAGPSTRGVVLVLHGIAGTADEPFVLRTARLANESGLDAFRLHLRGAGESRECGAAPLYHAGLAADLHAALELLGARYERVHAVGFSLGGHLVLRALGEWGAAAPRWMASATVISAPLALAESGRFSERRSAWIYRAFILRELRARYHAARRQLAHAGPDVDRAVQAARTIRDYDAAVVAPLFGFRDVEDYYARAGADAVVQAIHVPTLVLHASDDPLVPSSPMERLGATGHPHIRVEITAHGGHVGYLARRPAPGDRTRYWAEQRAIDLARALDAVSSG